MTRMQKYKEYREEIARSSKLGYSISLDNQKIAKYTNEINKINPAILNAMTDESMSLHKGVTEISIDKKQVPVEISKLFSTLNKAKNTINKENVNTLFFNLQNNSIIDRNNNVKSEWLKNNPDYQQLISFTSGLNLDKKDPDLQKNLENKYNDFTKQAKQITIANANEIVPDNKKQTTHYIFVVSVTIAIVFCLITFGLLITRMVIK